MASSGLRSALGLYAYTPPSNAYPLIVSELGALVDALEFTTVAPGGFGDLAAVVKLSDARIPRPELSIFSKVCLRDGLATCFAGEWSDPALILDGQHGEYVLLSALGGGVALRDDPDDSAYTAQTAQAIIASEFTKRSAHLAVDADQSAVVPSAPAATFSPVYDGFNLEEILHDLAFALGDYTWTVYEHPTHLDPAGFPTLQVQVHPRDTATTHYLATGEDIVSWRVTPSTQRAYNVVQVAYVDVTGGPGTVTVSDTRLNGDGSQGNAPFRRRKLRRSLGRAPLTSAQLLAKHDHLAAPALQHLYEALLGEIRAAQASFDSLASAATHFEQVTASYWPGLFHCYAVADLPKTNNDLEQYFGAARHLERRATGRKSASPALVVRGAVRVVAAVATRLQPLTAEQLQPADLHAWQAPQRRVEARHATRRAQARFRRDPQVYLPRLEDVFLKPALPS